jgi:hypothetical protein
MTMDWIFFLYHSIKKNSFHQKRCQKHNKNCIQFQLHFFESISTSSRSHNDTDVYLKINFGGKKGANNKMKIKKPLKVKQ